MGKRSAFVRRERDFYPTPHEAVLPLLAHLAPRTRFAEPCAGDGALIDHLTAAGHVCAWGSDILPQRDDIFITDFADIGSANADCFITNPPWDRSLLREIIVHLSDMAPTWLLFDADWVHTRQAAPFLPRLRRIVSVGRVKWIPDSSFTGKDNCAWHLFDRPATNESCRFYGRAA